MKIHKEMTNLEIAELLRDIAGAYQLRDEEKNRFKIIAYQRAADAIEHLSSEAKDLWDEGKLDEIPSVGKSIAQHLAEIFAKGKSQHFEKIIKDIPEAVFTLMELPGIGIRTAHKLVSEFNLDKSKKPILVLEKAAKDGKIALLEGFGEQSQADILRAIEEDRRRVKRHLLPYALNIANEVIPYLTKDKSVIRADALGSLRRLVSTVGDIDIAIASKTPQKALDRFTQYPKKVRLLEKGERTASILLPGGVQVDAMVQEPESYGSLLQHFTGSKHHNIALREFALKQGLSLSEYGIKELKAKSFNVKTYKNEEDFYKALGLDWIPPELREDAGEIEASKEHKLPKLLSFEDIKADLQIHSSFDVETSHDLGESTMEEIIKKAGQFGYEYLAFTEHNPSRGKHSDSEILDILKRKNEAVEQINYSLGRLAAKLVKSVNNRVKRVFNSLEIDIRPHGKLAIPEKGLNFLDFAIVSIHSSFRQTKEESTKRVLSALEYPNVKILAHPTARKLNEREGVEFDWPKIFDFCLKNNKWLEINSDPMRLDLPDFMVREAIKYGVKLTLGTDSHHVDGLENLVYGVYVARRGWAEKENIINTRSLEDFEDLLEQ